jgi:NitT/TauT family transport system substrate-binding protein
MEFRAVRSLVVVMSITLSAGLAQAQDTLRLAIGQRGAWDTSVADLGQKAGIFKKHGLQLELLYTQGGGETQQAVISGSVDIGVAVGIMGVIAAYSKGAPVRIIGAESTGAGDLYWYVRNEAPIKSVADLRDKKIAFSTNGSSSHGVVVSLLKQNSLSAQAVATGNAQTTLTQVMSGQIDVGWAAPPFGLDQLERNLIRIIATGNDSEVFRGQTVRVLISNLQTIRGRESVLKRFATAYDETLDWMYADPKALPMYAEFAGITEAQAKRIRDEFFPRTALDRRVIVGLDAIVGDAVTLKYSSSPLSKEQIAELIQISK